MAGKNEIEILIKARDEASRALDAVNKKIKDLEGSAGSASGALGTAESGVTGLGISFGVLAAAVVAGTAAMASFVSLVKKGIQSIDDLRLAQASMAAAAVSNDPSKTWEQVYETTGRIVEKVYELDRAFIGTGDELLILADSMVTFGMGIDLTTKKQQDQFVGFANMIKMLTRGQDFQRQAFQEIRSLMEGANVQGALLVKKLEAAGVNVKAMIPEWREQGILLEKIMEILPGYAQGSKEIENTLQAQKSSLETIAYKILREGMAGAYKDITGWVKGINDALMDQNGLTERGLVIVRLLKDGWDAVGGAIKNAGGFLLWLADNTLKVMDFLGRKMDAINRWATEKDVLAGRDWSAAMSAEMGAGFGAGDLKLAPGRGGGTDEAALKAAESLAKKIEALYDKIAIEAARDRGGDIAAELEKSRIDWIRRNQDLIERQIASKIAPDERKEQLLLSEKVYQNERTKIITKSEERIAEEVNKIRKRVAADELKDRIAQIQEIARRAGEELKTIQRQDEFRVMIDEMIGDFEKIEMAWGDIMGGMNREFSDLFLDGFRGDLRSATDYFDAFTDVIRRAWSNLLADILSEQMNKSFGGGIRSALSSFAGLFTGGGWAGGNPVGGLVDTAMPGYGLYGFKEGGITSGQFAPIRAFQHGGIIDRTTFGVIGEGGPEAVIPLRGGKVPVEMKGSQGDVNVNFTIVAADTRDMDRLLMDRRSLIMGMFTEGMRNASPLRDGIRKYK